MTHKSQKVFRLAWSVALLLLAATGGVFASGVTSPSPWTLSGTNIDLLTTTNEVRVGGASGTAKLNVIAEASLGAFQVRDSAGTLLLEVGRLGNNRTEAVGFYDAAGSDGFQLSVTNMNLASTFAFSWRSVANWFGGVADLGLARSSAGVARVTDGSTGLGDLLHSLDPRTATATLVTNDSGALLLNDGAVALVTYTLPGAAAGLVFEVAVNDADGIRVVAATGDTIRLGASVSAAAGNIQATAIGSSVRLVAVNATEWIAVAVTGGPWTVT